MDAGTLVLVGLGVAGAVAAMPVSQWLRRRARIRQRMARLDLFSGLREDDAAAASAPDEARDERALAIVLDRIYPLSGGLRTGLVVLVGGGIAALLGFWLLVFFGLAVPFALIGGLGLGILVGWNVGSAREGGQRVRFADRLLAAVDDMQRMVRAGMGLAEAFRAVTAAADEPVAGSLRRVGHAMAVGVPMASALDGEARRVGISDLAMLAAIFATQSRVGGGIAESVSNLADMLRERKDNRTRAKSATAESKLSLIVLSVVPFAAIGIQGATKPEIFDLLLGDARHLLGIGMGLVLTGLACAWLLVRRVRK